MLKNNFFVNFHCLHFLSVSTFYILPLDCVDVGSISFQTITNGNTATVTFSLHPDATFTCQLDSGTAVACKLHVDGYIHTSIIRSLIQCPSQSKLNCSLLILQLLIFCIFSALSTVLKNGSPKLYLAI